VPGNAEERDKLNVFHVLIELQIAIDFVGVGLITALVTRVPEFFKIPLQVK